MNPVIRRLSQFSDILNAKSYLEIGVSLGTTFNKFNIESKDAVDPRFQFDKESFTADGVRFFEVTSDEYFLKFNNGKKYDLIFIDGLHTFEQTFRDFCATLSTSHERTVWLIDDVFPVDVFSAHPDHKKALRFRHKTENKRNDWHGDVYKVVFAIHDFFPNMSYRTIRTGPNPQTVVWRAARPAFKPIFNNLEAISRLDFYEMSDRQDVFQFGSDEEVLADLRKWAGS